MNEWVGGLDGRQFMVGQPTSAHSGSPGLGKKTVPRWTGTAWRGRTSQKAPTSGYVPRSRRESPQRWSVHAGQRLQHFLDAALDAGAARPRRRHAHQTTRSIALGPVHARTLVVVLLLIAASRRRVTAAARTTTAHHVVRRADAHHHCPQGR